jgi:hypothetical protein
MLHVELQSGVGECLAQNRLVYDREQESPAPQAPAAALTTNTPAMRHRRRRPHPNPSRHPLLTPSTQAAAAASRQLLSPVHLRLPVISPQSAIPRRPLTCARRSRPTAYAPATHASEGRISRSCRLREHGRDSSSRAGTLLVSK